MGKRASRSARFLALAVVAIVATCFLVGATTVDANAQAGTDSVAEVRVDAANAETLQLCRFDDFLICTVVGPAFFDTDFDFVEGKDWTPPSPSWVKPRVGTTYPDPAYGLDVRRLTDATGTRFDRNRYSRIQTENIDGSMFLTYHGDAKFHVYDRLTTQRVRRLDLHPGAQPQWHPSDPHLIRHVAGDDSSSGDLRYYELDIATGRSRVIGDLTNRIRARFPTADHMHDRDEGSPSADGNRIAWIIYDASERALGIVHYDLATDRVLGLIPVRTDLGRLDWVSSSPTGHFVAAGYLEATTVLDADLSGERTILLGGEHSDLGLTADGRDTYVYIDFTSGPDGGWLVAVDLATGARTRLFFIWDGSGTSMHISMKNYARPGWALVSTYNCHVDFAWTCTKLFAVELGGNHRIINLAHTYNCGAGYWTETHGSVNRDFSRVYFNSDGGSCGIDAEVYEVTVPPLPPVG